MKIVFTFLQIGFCIPSFAQYPKLDKKGNLVSMDEVDISSMVQPLPEKNKFVDSNYNIWCGSVTKGKNGKFYMLYSRWPKACGHEAWITNSEIALAKSDKPEGPYRHVKVVFPARGNQYWDGVCTHNPAVIQYNGKYYLFYMGSTGRSFVQPNTSYDNPNWWEYRNNQRIGVAVTDDPEGDWQRFDQPVLDVSKDSTAYDALLVSNPAITVDSKGEVILIYKQVAKNGTMKGGRVRFGVAFSKSLLGPFVKHPSPVFEAKDGGKEWMVAEDPYLWSYKKSNYAIVRDVVGKFTGEAGALALLSSTNGIDWLPTKYPKVMPNHVQMDDGTLSEDKLERPCLYTENGLPVLLFGALGINHRQYSINVAVPLKIPAVGGK
ncbi:hypothetical protein FW778_00450 [Ginsengibacter hankyongi]|uniref:Glycosyl hydrolases family 43 n=1 Tax=Ginsengibacter hankyongi TaxID=2607284 RepID=A0A5J5IME2_9BACT|nr:hypothetical protein FW778_00450 [Ginsengibacter hankyongi]